MMRKNRGFTLLEVLVAAAILFLVTVYVMELFGSGLTSTSKSEAFTTATFLAQQKMEETLYQTDLSTGAGPIAFPIPFNQYAWTTKFTPYAADPNFNIVTVNVTGPHGEQSNLSSLMKGTLRFYGVATDEFGRVAFLADNAASSPQFDYYPGSGTTVNKLGGGASTGVATDSNAQTAWVGDADANQIWYYDGTNFQGPYALPGVMGQPKGLATDAFASVVFVADSNGYLAKYVNGAWSSPDNTLKGDQLEGIATDSDANIVWVADVSCPGNVPAGPCLRRYVDGTGFDATRYAPPLATGIILNSPQGVATTQFGDIVYLVDKTNLVEYNFNSNSWSVVKALDSGIHLASGLATDSTGSVFWVNDPVDHQLWNYYNGTWQSPIATPNP